MERREALGAAGGLRGESPGAAPKGVPEGVRTEEADAGPPSGVVPSQGSGPSPHSVEIVTCAPGSSRPTAGVAVLGSGPHRPPGEVASLSAGSGTHPDGLPAPFPEASVCGTCSPGSGGSGVYSWECSPSRSGSTCLNLHKPCEDWPRSILKTSTTILMQKSLSADKYGIQLGRLPAPSPEGGVRDTGGGGARGGGGVPTTWKPGRHRATGWETRGPGPWGEQRVPGPCWLHSACRSLGVIPIPRLLCLGHDERVQGKGFE